MVITEIHSVHILKRTIFDASQIIGAVLLLVVVSSNSTGYKNLSAGK